MFSTQRLFFGGLLVVVLFLAATLACMPMLWHATPHTAGGPSHAGVPMPPTTSPVVAPPADLMAAGGYGGHTKGTPRATPTVSPLPSPAPVPTPGPAPTPAPTNPTNPNTSGKPSCPNGIFDICAGMYDVFVNNIVKPVLAAFQNTVGQVNDLVWTTPAKSSYQNESVTNMWQVSLWLVNIAVAAVIAWAALRHMLGITFGDWLSYADFLEILPRLAFGLLAAYCSLKFCGWIVDISNALAKLFSTDMLNTMTKNGSDNTVVLTFQVIYAMMGFLLLLEEGARYALLYVLMAFAPLWAFAAALRETAPLARTGVKAFVLFTLLQPAQLAVLMLGGGVIAALVKNPAQLTVLSILVGLGVLLIVLLMFFGVAQYAMSGLALPLAGAATGATAYLGARAGQMLVKGGRKTGRGIAWVAKNDVRAVGMAGLALAKGTAEAVGGSITTISGGVQWLSDRVTSGVAGGAARLTSRVGGAAGVVSSASRSAALPQRRPRRWSYYRGRAAGTIRQGGTPPRLASGNNRIARRSLRPVVPSGKPHIDHTHR